MKKNFKAIIFLCFLYACSSAVKGNIVTASANFDRPFMSFEYIVYNEQTIVLNGTIGHEFYTGHVFPLETVRKVEMSRFPQISPDIINRENIYAFSKLASNKGRTIECFIVQRSPRKFSLGGTGRCYTIGNRIFDIAIQPAESRWKRYQRYLAN